MLERVNFLQFLQPILKRRLVYWGYAKMSDVTAFLAEERKTSFDQ